MRIGIVTRQNENQWGGDLKALYSIRDGLDLNGHEVKTAPNPNDLLDCDFVFLSNTCLDQRENYKILKKNKIKYGVICFHEDFDFYLPKCLAFASYVINSLKGEQVRQIKSDLNQLFDNPQLIEDASKHFEHQEKGAKVNYEVLKDAEFCIANSEMEKETVLRDCPEANVEVVYWTSGFADEWDGEVDNSFLDLAEVEENGYMLQVGRMETRKNQLGAILAARNIKTPLVIIATKGYQDWYERSVIDLCLKYRKHKTIILSENYESKVYGPVEVKQMPNGEKLSGEMLEAAFKYCKVNLHPAFYELPGYTYLEALRYNRPSVVSEWTSIKDYANHFEGDRTIDGLFNYCYPYDVNSIESALHNALEKSEEVDNEKKEFNVLTRAKENLGKDINHILEDLKVKA